MNTIANDYTAMQSAATALNQWVSPVTGDKNPPVLGGLSGHSGCARQDFDYDNLSQPPEM